MAWPVEPQAAANRDCKRQRSLEIGSGISEKQPHRNTRRRDRAKEVRLKGAEASTLRAGNSGTSPFCAAASQPGRRSKEGVGEQVV